MANVDEVTRGLLKDPTSEKWREEFSKLSKQDKEEVLDLVDIEAMGTGIPAEKFQDFWKYVEEMDKKI